MFGFFRKKKNRREKSSVKIEDITSSPLHDGDVVDSLRYNLGRCVFRMGEDGAYYESVETGEQISYTKMIDASTMLQKVKKVET